MWSVDCKTLSKTELGSTLDSKRLAEKVLLSLLKQWTNKSFVVENFFLEVGKAILITACYCQISIYV